MSSRIHRALACGALALFPALCQAEGATIRFSGAIVEPACTFATAAISYTGQQAQSAPLELDVRCHAAQAVRLSFEQGGRETRAGFDTGAAGVTMRMSRDGKPLPPGEAIPLALAARSQQRIRLDTQLHRNAASQAQDKIHSTLLVALDYQ